MKLASRNVHSRFLAIVFILSAVALSGQALWIESIGTGCNSPESGGRFTFDVLSTFFSGRAPLGTKVAKAKPLPARGVNSGYGQIPLHFEANRGQMHDAIDFLARGAGYSLFLTPADATFVLQPSGKDEGAPSQAGLFRMSFAGARRDGAAEMVGQLEGRVNYFIGNDPAAWRTDIPTFARVLYKGIYPGIDLVYYGNQRQLEYDLVVAPGADWRQIAITFTGTDGLAIEAESGDLLARVGAQTVRQHKPVVYQEVAGQRREIESGYVLASNNRVEFTVGDYDRTRTLIIDPVLVYATYVGADDSFNSPNAIAVDSTGSVYITGTTVPGLPTTPEAFDTSFNGGARDVFVTKLNPTGTALVYSTYIGGGVGVSGASNIEVGNAIALDTDGNAYITGRTNAGTFPTTEGALDRTFNAGGTDGFVTKLNSTGSALIYSTFLGSSSEGLEEGMGIAVNAAGNAFVTGYTRGTFSNGVFSTTFPTTNGAYDTMMECNVEVYVAKLNTTGTGLEYSTLLNASNSEGIAIDSEGNAYITGRDQWGCAPFPTTSGAYKTNEVANEDDIFITKFNSTGSALIYSTRFGADCHTGGFASFELGYAIAVDSAGSAYITGAAGACYDPQTGTEFSTFPTTTGAYDTNWNDGDGFAAKFNPSGSALVYSTFFPGGSTNLALDPAGNAWVSSRAIPPTDDAFDKVNENGRNAVIAKLNSTGSGFLYSTYFGGNSTSSVFIGGLALDTAGNLYLAGTGDAIPTTPGVYKTTTASTNAFVAKIGEAPPVIQMAQFSDGHFFLEGVGVPGQSYSVEATEDLSQEFLPIGMTTVADANGNFQFQDSPGTGVTNRFYQIVNP